MPKQFMDQPLALPAGSVRAILAIALTGAAIAASFMGVAASEYLWPASLTVNAFYFAKKSIDV